jgi:FtsP/CotA-like multicopper oxidase with cupredoxin domain
MISITVKNSLDEGTSMHWHGEDIPVDIGCQLLTILRTTAKSNSMV